MHLALQAHAKRPHVSVEGEKDPSRALHCECEGEVTTSHRLKRQSGNHVTNADAGRHTSSHALTPAGSQAQSFFTTLFPPPLIVSGVDDQCLLHGQHLTTAVNQCQAGRAAQTTSSPGRRRLHPTSSLPSSHPTRHRQNHPPARFHLPTTSSRRR